VARGGLDALSAEERKEIPQDMDMANESYRKRLKDVYADHPQGTTFENFYQSQILWDETMAHSAAKAMGERPDFQMVVLAGVEHVMYGSGIPGRIHRLTNKDSVTLINGVFDRDIGTYVLFPNPLDPPYTARLGVIVKEAGGAVVNDFSQDSPAFKAGMRAGDRIIFIDGWKIGSLSDIKIALFDKEPGQTVTVKVARKRFIFGDTELEFHVSL
jgi:membrane-associated protease RseP (regulator of RpoE activity)